MMGLADVDAGQIEAALHALLQEKLPLEGRLEATGASAFMYSRT